MGSCFSRDTATIRTENNNTIASGRKGNRSITTDKTLSTYYESNDTAASYRDSMGGYAVQVIDTSDRHASNGSDLHEDVDDQRFAYLWRRTMERTVTKCPRSGSSDIESIEQIMEDLSAESHQESKSTTLQAKNYLESKQHGCHTPKRDFSQQTLHEIVDECVRAGADEEAIDIITQVLIENNATSMSSDIASFCLAKLWDLARRSNANCQKIMNGTPYEAILETMEIYRKTSACIQTRACAVLWSLSTNVSGRKHVARNGGCEAILNAMLVHTGDDALHEVALRALKSLSEDDFGKSIMHTWGASSIIADIMRKRGHNARIQSGGYIVMDNLTPT